MEEHRSAICGCGKDLGRKRIDLPHETKSTGVCPHCQKPYMIINGVGKVIVVMRG